MTEPNEVSAHAVRIYQFFKSRESQWVTASTIATGASVALRTARAYAKRFTDLGIVDVAEVWPGHRYRLSSKAGQRNKGYLQRLETAITVLSEVQPQ